jgi:hypothetical protein
MTDAFLAGLDLGPQGGQVLGPGGGATDGGEFLFLQQAEGRVELCASSPEGPARVIRETAPGPQTGDLYDYSLGVYGDWVAYAETFEQESTLFLSTGDGEPVRTLATIDGGVHGISWSHDRRWIVAGRWLRGQGEDRLDVQSHHFDLLLVGVTPEGEAATEPRILETEAWIPLGSPQWLPGDETVALFGMAPDGPNHLWLISIRQGDPAVTLAMGEPSGIGSASLSPDGRHVAFSQVVPHGSSIWMVDYGEFLSEQGLLGR